MKYLLLVGFIFGLLLPACAQETRKVYLGIGTGVNYPAGLIGISLELQLTTDLTAYGALGMGSWGGKVGAGLRYYVDYPKSWAFGLGYSYATGIDDVDLTLENSYVYSGGSTGTTAVNFKLLPVSTINISVLKQWMIGKQKRNRIGLELGYAIPTATDRYQVAESLTSKGKNFMNLMQPGGLLLGTTLSFGF
jgi:hypothetical protein